MPFSRKIRVEQDLGGVGTEATGEALAVVGQDLIGDPVAGERDRQDLAHCLGRRPGDQAGGDAEPAVVIDTGHDLEL
jgi:hypothetical protein